MKKFIQILSVVLALFLGACKTAENKAPSKGHLGDREKLLNTSLFIDATRERLLGNTSRAKELYTFCLQNDPENDAAMYELSRIEADATNMDEALNLIKTAIKKDPSNKWYRIHYADILERTGQFTDAAAVYRELSLEDPQNPDIYIEEANAWIQANKIEEALVVFDKLESQIGVSEEVSVQKYRMYLFLNQEDKALNELLILSANFPAESRFLNMIIEHYFSAGKLVLAYENALRLLAMNPQDPYVHLYLSEYFNALGEKDQSNEELRLAFINPELSIDLKISMLLKLYQFGTEPSELVFSYELLDILVNAHPMEAKAYAMYADFLSRDDREIEAINMWKKSLVYNQSVFSVWEQLMMAMYDNAQFDSLSSVSVLACETFPEQGMAHYFAGLAYYEKGLYDQALASLEIASDFSSSKPELLLQIQIKTAETQAGLKNVEVALGIYKQLMTKHSDNMSLLISYGFFLGRDISNFEQASEIIQKALKINAKDPLALSTAAWISAKQGKNDIAQDQINRALLNADPNNFRCFERCGDALYWLDKKTDACEMWKKAHLLNPSNLTLNKKQNDCVFYQ